MTFSVNVKTQFENWKETWHLYEYFQSELVKLISYDGRKYEPFQTKALTERGLSILAVQR